MDDSAAMVSSRIVAHAGGAGSPATMAHLVIMIPIDTLEYHPKAIHVFPAGQFGRLSPCIQSSTVPTL